MAKRTDISNRMFGRLRPIQIAETPIRGRLPWKCLCECGNIVFVCSGQLVSGNTKSCGCLKSDSASERFFIDLSGKTFSGWTVIRRTENRGRRTMWECVCVCGAKRDVQAESLTSGKSASCGCISREATSQRSKTHGMRHTREWNTWNRMIQRCTNKKNPAFKDYGGRGIFVCERWLNSFENFYADMGDSNGLQIDRINNNGNYEPGNCRWTTCKQNCRNRRNSRLIEFGGETKCVTEWAEHFSVCSKSLSYRIRSGMSFEEAISLLKSTSRNNLS